MWSVQLLLLLVALHKVRISTQEIQRFTYLKDFFLFPPFFVILIDYANLYCTNRCFPNNSWSFLFVTFISSACSSFYCVWPSVVLNGGYFPRGDSNSLSSVKRVWSISFQNALQLLKECNILALKIFIAEQWQEWNNNSQQQLHVVVLRRAIQTAFQNTKSVIIHDRTSRCRILNNLVAFL